MKLVATIIGVLVIGSMAAPAVASPPQPVTWADDASDDLSPDQPEQFDLAQAHQPSGVSSATSYVDGHISSYCRARPNWVASRAAGIYTVAPPGIGENGNVTYWDNAVTSRVTPGRINETHHWWVGQVNLWLDVPRVILPGYTYAYC